MRFLRASRLWFALGLALGIVALAVLDGAAAGVVLTAAGIALFVGVMRVLSHADVSGVTHGGEGGGGGF